MAIQVKHGADARNAILSGAKILSEAVKVTLGPKGRNVIIEKSYGSPQITKDGVTVAKAIEVEDPFENLGAQTLKSAAQKTGDHTGDGTTTCTVLAYEILKRAQRHSAANLNITEMAEGIREACQIVAQEAMASASKVQSNSDEIERVARVSANNETEIGRILAKAVSEVGRDGVITVQEGQGWETQLEITGGMEIDKGYLSPYFVTNSEKMMTDYTNCMVLVTDYKISSIKTILPILEASAQQGKPLVIICDDLDGEALSTLVVNRLRGSIKAVAIKAPGFGDRKKDILQDIAVLTGATLITEEAGHKLEDAQIDALGTLDKIEVYKDRSVLVGGHMSNSSTDQIKQAIEERCTFIRKSIEASTSDYDKEKLQERLAKLSGGVAVIKVGGATEAEMKERKDRVTDAWYATKAALEGGVIPGGGVFFLRAAQKLDGEINKMKNVSEDYKMGMRVVSESLSAPLRTIVENASGSMQEAYAVEISLRNNADKPNYGYDARNCQYGDMMELGIIDPAKVAKDAIINAGSAASTLLTAECAIVKKVEKESKSPSPHDMGGMY